MIYTNSRYAGQPVLRVQGTDGITRPVVYRSWPPRPARFLHYTVSFGDRMDKLAVNFYNDPTQWWRIADANPEIFHPSLLVPGSVIRIPQV